MSFYGLLLKKCTCQTQASLLDIRVLDLSAHMITSTGYFCSTSRSICPNNVVISPVWFPSSIPHLHLINLEMILAENYRIFFHTNNTPQHTHTSGRNIFFNHCHEKERTVKMIMADCLKKLFSMNYVVC